MSYALHKGYVPTKNKKCLMPFKDKTTEELMTYDEVKGLPEFAGILNTDTILVDIDEESQYKLLLDMVDELQLRCRVYKSRRGGHFLFKNDDRVTACKTHTKLACGLTADIKIGKKNSYSVLKIEGKERKIEYDILEGEDYETVPAWLLPVKTETNFIGMGEGDGRNQALFNHILTLQEAELDVEEIRETLKIINSHMFAKPLTEQEVETISREEAFPKREGKDDGKYFKNNAFLFDKFAKNLVEKRHIKRINNRLHIYEDGVYVPGEAKIERAMIDVLPTLSRTKRNEALSYINLLTLESETKTNTSLIAFKNGVYSVRENKLLEFSPEHVVTNKINHDYHADAYSEIMDKTLNKLACDDHQIRSLMEEMIGYCFYRDNFLRKAFILTGAKRNGKSTFLDVLIKLLGEENTTSLDLKELGDRFKTAELFNKLANIGDDIEDDFIASSSVFKKVVAGNRVNAERKGMDPFDFSSYATQVFSANDVPRMKDKTGAVLDRLKIIPFETEFKETDADFDPYIKTKLESEESLEYLLVRGLEGLKRILKNRKFTDSDRVNARLKEYDESNNPILAFFKESEEENYAIENQPTKHVYQRYIEFCLSNNLQPLSNIAFTQQVKKYKGYGVTRRSIAGKKYRVFAADEQGG